MARPLDLHRRETLLAATVDYLSEHGLAGLSLRPLAQAIGTTDRMLIHHFQSKERMVGQALAASLPRWDELAPEGTAPQAIARELWRRMTRGDQRGRVQLMLEVMALSMTQPGYRDFAATATRNWVEAVTAILEPAGVDDAPTVASVLVSGLKGLALDIFVTGDTERVDAAAGALIDQTLARGCPLGD